MRRWLMSVVGLIGAVAVTLGVFVAATRFGSAKPGWAITDLGALAPHASSAEAVNERGEVVGVCSTGSVSEGAPLFRACLWRDGTLQDLGTLGGVESSPVGINDGGQVAGRSDFGKGKPPHAFLWASGQMRDLGTLGGTSSDVEAINDRGQVVGMSELSDLINEDAFVWQDGTMRDLGSGTHVTDINNRGQIIGTSGEHGVVWQGGTMRDLGAMAPWVINERGQIAGETRRGESTRAVLWANGTIVVLPILDKPEGVWPSCTPTAINERGWVVGFCHAVVGTTLPEREHLVWQRAVLWRNLKATDLGTLGGDFSQAFAINDHGQIVGSSDTRTGSSHAFVWENGAMVDLGTLDGGSESDATAINNRGQIAGTSSTRAGTTHAVLWTPVGD